MADKKEVLICIAFHYTDFTYPFVCKVLKNITDTYACTYDIVVHTNTQASADLIKNNFKNVETIVKENQGFNLTWAHREYIAKNMHNYENCMYIEDDMVVPYDSYVRYIENFWILWPDAVPGLLRYEEVDNVKFFNELKESLWRTYIINKNDRVFAYWTRAYCALWIAPTKILKKCVEFLGEDFLSNVNLNCQEYVIDGVKNRHPLSRENAASFTNWQLGKPTYIELGATPQPGEVLNIIDTSTCAHGSNKYFGVLKVKPGERWDNIKYSPTVKPTDFIHPGESFTYKIHNL